MFSNKLLSAFIGAGICFAACEKESSIDKSEEIIVDDDIVSNEIEPVDFRFLTLNFFSMYGDNPSISFFDYEGLVSADIYKKTNNESLVSNTPSVLQVSNRLFVSYYDAWGDNGFMEVNPNSFKLIKKKSFETDFIPKDMIYLGGDSMLIAGDEKNAEYNMVIGDINTDDFTKRELYTGNKIEKIIRVKDKIFFFGGTSKYNASVLSVTDINNISNDNFRTIIDPLVLGSNSAVACVDKNNNIWFANEEASGFVFYCLDTKTEQIKQKIESPYYITPGKDLSIVIDDEKTTIYLRSHKAFTTLNIDNPIFPDEPIYQYKDHVGTLLDLKFADNGNLLFLNEVIGAGKMSEVIEIKPNKDSDWEIVKISDTGISARKIFVPSYEK